MKDVVELLHGFHIDRRLDGEDSLLPLSTAYSEPGTKSAWLRRLFKVLTCVFSGARLEVV
jgi:hypothetical protein